MFEGSGGKTAKLFSDYTSSNKPNNSFSWFDSAKSVLFYSILPPFFVCLLNCFLFFDLL